MFSNLPNQTSSLASSLINLSCYCFRRLAQLPALRAELRALCLNLKLKGTILIAEEGMNVGVCGRPEAIEEFKAYLSDKMGVEPSTFKETLVQDQSFRRMLVKIKKEIISVGDVTINPTEKTAKRVSAAELKKWLDEGRPLVLLDTRNRYEIELGTFVGAQDLGLDTSREFAKKAELHLESLKNQTVVSFCTGGIRCEKASAVLLKLGLTDVYQLDGGILRYLEENGAAYYQGNCFVFDWRLAVNAQLAPVPRSDRPDAQFGRHCLLPA